MEPAASLDWRVLASAVIAWNDVVKEVFLCPEVCHAHSDGPSSTVRGPVFGAPAWLVSVGHDKVEAESSDASEDGVNVQLLATAEYRRLMDAAVASRQVLFSALLFRYGKAAKREAALMKPLSVVHRNRQVPLASNKAATVGRMPLMTSADLRAWVAMVKQRDRTGCSVVNRGAATATTADSAVSDAARLTTTRVATALLARNGDFSPDVLFNRVMAVCDYGQLACIIVELHPRWKGCREMVDQSSLQRKRLENRASLLRMARPTDPVVASQLQTEVRHHQQRSRLHRLQVTLAAAVTGATASETPVADVVATSVLLAELLLASFGGRVSQPPTLGAGDPTDAAVQLSSGEMAPNTLSIHELRLIVTATAMSRWDVSDLMDQLCAVAASVRHMLRLLHYLCNRRRLRFFLSADDNTVALLDTVTSLSAVQHAAAVTRCWVQCRGWLQWVCRWAIAVIDETILCRNQIEDINHVRRVCREFENDLRPLLLSAEAIAREFDAAVSDGQVVLRSSTSRLGFLADLEALLRRLRFILESTSR